MTFKKLLPVFLAWIILTPLCLTSCSEDDDKKSDEALITEIQSDLKSGTWSITRFVDSDEDETSDFTGYMFTFASGGVITASNGINNYSGTWSISDGNSSDDNPDDLDFNIFFNLTNQFEDLSDDWEISSQSAIKIELMDVSGGDGSIDYLTFEKN